MLVPLQTPVSSSLEKRKEGSREEIKITALTNTKTITLKANENFLVLLSLFQVF